MTNCNQTVFEFPVLKRRKVQAEFSGGDITSDGGVLLLRQIDLRLGLMKAVDAVIPDPRNPDYITHSQLSLLRQRVYGLSLGYEDLNDHKTLRNDPALQTAVDREQELGSQSTLCRLEGRTGRKAAVDIHRVLIDQFIASFDSPPDELILDFDATDDQVHGMQEGRFFHGYYDHYCFLPLYVFCGDQLLVSYLRPCNIDGAKHTWAILALLTKRLRQEWPDVQIIFRGDSGFCRHRMLDWCERQGVKYIVGIARNKRLEQMIEPAMQIVEQLVELTGEKQREFFRLHYAAKSWKHTRQAQECRYLVKDFGTSKSPKSTRLRDSHYAPTVLRTSRFRIAHCSKAACALLHHDSHNDSTAFRVRSLYALHRSLPVAIPAIQPRLRL
ncbi:MAG: IS1380 family transposase [Candidatus Sedimenticola sp. (ex Thyasira tokunagai)]